jgi:type IV secretion system protein VirB9
MKFLYVCVLAVACLCGPVLADEGAVTGHNRTPSGAGAGEVAKRAQSQDVRTDAAPPQVRVVPYGDKDIIRIRTKCRYSTLIVIPKAEKILDFICGDRDFWAIQGAENIAYVKPAKVGAETNLNLITASGNIYSFVLGEVSEVPDSSPDLKVVVEVKDEAMISAAGGAPRFVSTQAIDDWRQQVEIAKEETQTVKRSSQVAIDRSMAQFVSNVRFPYIFKAGEKPFYVRAMYNDDKFTYLLARPEETPTLYEVKDGKPSLVNFEYRNGMYVVEKILDQGYLAIGKKKLDFRRRD